MKTTLKHVLLILTALSSTACAVIPKNEIQTEALLPATPNQVWQVLTDGPKYSEWNPFITNVDGQFIPGQRVANTMRPTPDKEMVFKPKVLVATPSEELRWLGRAGVPGIFDGEHYFLLEPIDNQTRLVHGEKFSGFALWFMDTNKFERNLIDMNLALKTRLEDLYGPQDVNTSEQSKN